MKRMIALCMTLLLAFSNQYAFTEEMQPQQDFDRMIYDIAVEQLDQFKSTIHWRLEEKTTRNWGSDEILEALSEIIDSEPQKIGMYMPIPEVQKDNFRVDDTLIDELYLISSACLSTLTRVNSFYSLYNSIDYDLLAVYDTAVLKDFQGVAYVLFYYGEDAPAIITAFAPIKDGEYILKTVPMYGGNTREQTGIFQGMIYDEFGTDGFEIYLWEDQ